MAEITNELIYELLKRMQADIANLKEGQRDLRQDNLSIRNQLHSLQGDVNNLRASVGHIETRLDRIENRFDLRELAERGQASFDLSS
jgi:hypothetical protein